MALLRPLSFLLMAGCSVPGVRVHSEDDTGPGPTPAGAGSLLGTVVDAGGEPIAGARLTTRPHGYEATSDAAGAWRIDRLPSGTYTVVAAAPAFEAAESEAVEVEEGGEATADVALAAAEDGAVLTVQVEGPDGLPIEGATVSLSTGEATVTDADGVGVVTGLAAGPADLSVSADGLWPATVPGLELPEDGGAQVAITLAGRAPEGTAFIGSTLCLGCHEAMADHSTPHSRSLTEGGASDLDAAFDGATTVDLSGGATAVLAAGPSVVVTDSSGEARTWEVAGWIGDIGGGSVPWAELGDQAYALPVAWVAAGEREDWDEAAWVAWETSTWVDTGGAFAFDERPDPSLSAEARCLGCHATGYTLAARSDGGADMAATSGGGRWVEAGVGCESCHGPGRAHLENAGDDAVRPRMITRPDLLDVDRAADVCARCHSGRSGVGNGLPFAYSDEAGAFLPGGVLAEYADSASSSWPSGAADAPGRQSDEIALSLHGPSGRAFRCFDCHDAHGEAADSTGEALPSMLRLDPRDNALCATCHLGLTFEGDEGLLEDHPAHGLYTPDGATGSGRCTFCHMPETAARLSWSDASGAGDRSSHLFASMPPQDTIDVFEAAGATELPVGSFPIHGCADCHAYTDVLFGGGFSGPKGDPTQKATHEEFQAAWEDLY